MPTPTVLSVAAPAALRLKYAVGRLAAFAGLVLLLPLLAVIAIGVKLSSPGPVLYRQRRVGYLGRDFDILKFRSMSAATDDAFCPAEGQAPGGVEGVDRRTAFGCFLRRTSLDELPQLINVLRGEMSLVGPRPERPQFVARFSDEIPGYSDRHAMRPGITGLAQVRGLRGKTSIVLRAAADREYITSWSPVLDLRVLLLTGRAVLQGAE